MVTNSRNANRCVVKEMKIPQALEDVILRNKISISKLLEQRSGWSTSIIDDV